MLAIALSASALTTAAPVPVTGGSGRERAIVRHALAVLDPGAVTSARIDRKHYLVLGPPTRRDPSAAYLRAQWEARALVVSVAARFAAAGDRLAGYRVIGNCGHDASCGSGGSLTAAQAPATGPGDCRRLLADRWALLVPETALTCGGPAGGWVVSITGTFAGQPVSRGYDGCYGATALRWARFLGSSR
jgi:hypothetical protein